MAIFFSLNFSELSNFSFSSFWGKPIVKQKLLLLTATARRSCYTLVRPWTNKQWQSFVSLNFSELLNFPSSSFWEKPLRNQKLLLLNATVQHSCYTLVRPIPTLSCFLFFHKLFLELIFASKIKTILLKQSAVLFISCQKKIIAYIMCLNTWNIVHK